MSVYSILSNTGTLTTLTSSSFNALSFKLAVPVAPRSDFFSESCFFSTHSASLSLSRVQGVCQPVDSGLRDWSRK